MVAFKSKMEFHLAMVLCMGMMISINASPHCHESHNPLRLEEHDHHEDDCYQNQTSIANAINNFGFDLSEALEEPGNTFFSPLGLSMALGMAYLGARRSTAQQMEHALAYDRSNISNLQVHEGMQHLCAETLQRATENGNYKLNIVNVLFHQTESQLNEEFVQGIQVYYHGDALALDFAEQPEESTATINDWVKEKSENKIEKLFDDPLPRSTIVVLTNSIYFKGTWKIEFPEVRSYDGRFYVAETSEWKSTRMMSLAEETFPYLKDPEMGYKYLEMPYKGDQVSMLFALPINYNELPNLRMNEDLLCRIRSQMVETELETIAIPKFKVTYEKKMKGPLKSMGMDDAFTRGAANFSGISSQSLHISDVFHKAVIEVNEKGSEAAAVTGIVMVLESLREVTDFVADHAFLFYIIDKSSDVIIFSGKLMDP